MKSYTGRSTQPRRETIVYRCACGERYSGDVWRSISAEDAALRTRLIEGDLNRLRCPCCALASDVQVSVLYHDRIGRRLIYVAPTSERHRELALRAELFTLLAADATPPPDYVLAAQVVFGSAGLSETIAAVAPEAAAPHFESSELVTGLQPSLMVPPSVPSRADAEDLTITPAGAVELPRTGITARELDVARVLAQRPVVQAADAARDEATRVHPIVVKPEPIEGTHPRAAITVPDPRAAVVERWIAARESSTALFVDDRVVVCAALGPATLEQFIAREGKKVRVSLRLQLHRMSSFPIIALTFVAGEDGERPDETRVLHVPLDLSRAAHRVSLDQLSRHCAIELELFDNEYLPVVSLSVVLPLEEQVRHLVSEAKAALDRLPVATRDFETARTAFLGANYDRLGRTVIDLPNLDDVGRATPAAVRTALQSVSRWSEQAAESYLLEIRGYPLPVWRKLAAAVVRRAVEIGLFVPRGLAERVVRRADDGLDLPPWPELIELQIRRFAELSARLRPCDLVPADEAANWEQLLREAETQGVVVDEAISRLADAAFARAGGRPSRRARAREARGPVTPEQPVIASAPTAPLPLTKPARRFDAAALARAADPPADLAQRSSEELIRLLEDRDQRLVAATALAARHETASLPALISALRRMSRTEANVLLPRLLGFGPPVERWLIDGLRSKKAFMRQGCALALGRLGTPLAIDALVRLLFEEPTEIWTEIARAIGDVGAPAVMPLAARLREVEGDARDRIVQALAHIAARNGAATVESLAYGRDALVATAARRALVLAPEVQSAHQAVRAGRREQTLVRGFTWRFYDVLGGDDSDIPELDSGELLALEAEEALELDEEIEEDDDSEGIELDQADLQSSPSLLNVLDLREPVRTAPRRATEATSHTNPAPASLRRPPQE